MESAESSLSIRVAPGLGRLALWLATATTAVLALSRLATSFQRMISPLGRYDGIDIRFRWREVSRWFAGESVYGGLEHADYPPATYALLWPSLGWIDERHARWLWAASTVFMLIWLVWSAARECGVRSRLARACVGMIPLASYATGATLVVGQLSVHVVAALIAGLLTLARARTWRDDVLGSLAVIAALAKPTLAVPLVWVAVLVPGRLRPALLIGGGYLALSLWAARFQRASLFELLGSWLEQSHKVGSSSTAANLQAALEAGGLSEAFLPLALGLFVLTGAWVWRHRKVDVWILIGVTGLVARLWSYHREFDDLIALLPAIALLRLARFTRSGAADAAAAALGIGLLALFLAPYPLLRELGLRSAMSWALAGAWLAALGYLLDAAHRQRRASLRGASAVALAPDPPPREPRSAPLLGSGAHDGRLWLWISAALPALVLTGAYLWLAIAHRTPWLWSEIVHESGRYTLGQTIFYFSHFLREVPTLIAMVLFTLAAIGRPRAPERAGAELRRAHFVAASIAAAGLAALAFVATASRLGASEALRNLLQEYTRDDAAAPGSHWRYHWLSTLWFAAAVPLAVRLGAWVGGVARSYRGRARLQLAAWAYFGGLSLAFGLSPAIATDPLYVGHQAREIATHGLVTLPLVLAVVAWLDRRRPAGAVIPHPAPTFLWHDVAGAVAIPSYLGMVILVDGVAGSAQADGALSAVVAAHFFEHALDYAFVALLMLGAYGLLVRGSAPQAPSCSRAGS